MKCTSFFGHSWSSWDQSWGRPDRVPNMATSGFYSQRIQRRICGNCGYVETVWVNEWKLAEAHEEKGANHDQ